MPTKAELQKELDTLLKAVRPSVGIHIGTRPETVIETRVAIQSILESEQEQKTLRCALNALGTVCSVNHATVTGCNISLDKYDDSQRTA